MLHREFTTEHRITKENLGCIWARGFRHWLDGLPAKLKVGLRFLQAEFRGEEERPRSAIMSVNGSW